MSIIEPLDIIIFQGWSWPVIAFGPQIPMGNGFRLTVINHNDHNLEISLSALNIDQDAQIKWINLMTYEQIGGEKNKKSLQLNLAAHTFICIEFRFNH